MNFTLRQKLSVVIASVTAAFLFITAVSWYLEVQMENQTSIIRDRYIPHVELGYQLETQFENIGLQLRDAVSAQDEGGLAAAEESKKQLIKILNEAAGIVDRADLAGAKAALDDYFTAATETSRRLIKGENGLTIVAAMTQMQAKRNAATSSLDKVTHFDRGRLKEAFVAIAKAQKRSARTRLWVSLSCVFFLFSVYTWMGRVLMLRLKKISQGLARFGAGDFDELIPAEGKDELSELCVQINNMALRIRSLLRDIESFNYSIAHDLRSPLRSVIGFSEALVTDHGTSLAEDVRGHLVRISSSAQRMGHMIDGLLNMSRLNRAPISKRSVDLSQIAWKVIEVLKANDPDRAVRIEVQTGVQANGDPQLLDIALSNLIGNAWKFTKRAPEARIQFGYKSKDGAEVFYVKDNGAGFDMRQSDKLFGTFQRLHSQSEFEGHGIGLATVKNIFERHGGRIWAESEPGKGAIFFFTLRS